MADPTAVLGLLWTVATGIYDRIGSHHIGKSDLTFQLSWYKTYTTRDIYAMIDLAIRNDTFLEMHKGVTKWLEASGFRPTTTQRPQTPALLDRAEGYVVPWHNRPHRQEDRGWYSFPTAGSLNAHDALQRICSGRPTHEPTSPGQHLADVHCAAGAGRSSAGPKSRCSYTAVIATTNAIQAMALNLGVGPNDVPPTYV